MSWSETWMGSLGSLTHTYARYEEGAKFHRRSKPDLELVPGSATARFVDRRTDITTVVAVMPLPAAAWQRLIERLIERPRLAAAMITGELPVELNWLTEDPDAEGFPQVLPSDREFSYHCSCESWDQPCVHVWAVMFELGQMMVADPNVVLLLRGQNRQDLVEPIRAARGLVASAGPESSHPRGPDLGLTADYDGDLGPFPRQLPTPWRVVRPAVLPIAPPVDSGIDLADLAELVADGAARAMALLTGDASSGLHDPADVDVVRRAAAAPDVLHRLATAASLDHDELERRAIAWRLGGRAALWIHDERWEPGDGALEGGQAALGSARRSNNTLTAGRVQLRLDRTLQWWRFDSHDRLGWIATAGPFDDPADAVD
ncbi:MAG: hypothetical protein O3C27_12860 [Actinomycetota bacterium]|nr:hypothetical protein [Actinomycetota bacterium]